MSFFPKLPKSIYSRTMLLVGTVTFVLQIFTFTIFFRQMVLPNVYTQVEHFVDALETISRYPKRLQSSHFMVVPPQGRAIGDFMLATVDLQLQPTGWRIPFWYFVEDELEKRFGEKVPLRQELGVAPRQGRYWVDIPLSAEEGTLRVGFPAVRKGCLNLPVLLLVLLSVVTFSMVAVYFLSRWLVKPMEELQMAVGEMGRGGYPEPLPEKGPSEFSFLIQRFNWMVKSVQGLTENRSTLLAGISHDLKTPLARMRLSMELLSGDQDRDLVEGVIEDLDVMDSLISQALAFARGESPGEQEEVDINGLISTIVDRKRRGGVDIIWQPALEPCLRTIDPSALTRILSNYLDNSHRYGEGESIIVGLRCIADGAEIEVVDHGEGVAEEQLERLFQPFYRVDASRSEERGGSGLGLAIVKNLATINGWQVSLENHSQGGMV
ncbi:MAG: HAMP domain-containing protein, partial [Gammaproteobacteria bacterium]|nr:HAMP domain-containing protein [Gammaproteobacteria bacterium]